MLRLVPLHFVLYFLFIMIPHGKIVHSLTNENTSLCCQSQCGTNVLPVSKSLLDRINESPYYVQVFTPTIYSKGLDNECFTYVKTNDTSYTLFIGLRYSNGTGAIQKYAAFDLAGYCGVIRNENPSEDSGSCSFVFDEVYLGDACPEVRVYYRNYVAGPCVILGNISLIEADFIHGDSSSRDISDYCKSQVAAVASSQQLRGTQLVALPNRLNRCCVTQFNGASCVNADRVLPQDSVSVNL